MNNSDQNYILDPLNPQIVFILGGPGSGKGTQCERLVRDYHFQHISVGEVIRETIQRDPEMAARVKAIMERGDLIPDNIVVEALKQTIKIKKAQKYLIDGFPRNIDQAKLFESEYKEIDIIVNIEVEEQTLTDRLLKRAATSGRADDNEETIKNRIKVFNEKTAQVSEYYAKFGKIKHVNGNQIIDKVYAEVRQAIKPNIIFFMGPPAVGKSTVSKILADKLKYLYVHLDEFAKQYKCQNQEDLCNALMHYCQAVPHNCIIIDSFFTDHNQAEVFFNHFCLPQYVFYIESPKDEVYMNISKYYTCPKEKKRQQSKYEQYVQDRIGLLNLMKKRSFFKSINGATTIENIVDQVMQIQKPLTLVSIDYNNRDLAQDYYYGMETQRGYMICDLEELIEHECDRQTPLGKKLAAFNNTGQPPSNNYKVELVSKIMFNEPENTKFLFSNWPSNPKDFTDFEKSLYPVDYLLNFKAQDQGYTYKIRENAFLQYFSQGKVINVEKNALDILDSFTTPRAKYGFVAGPQAGGKSTIAKHIAATFDYELIDFTNETFLENVKAKYIKEDDEVQDVGYTHIKQYFIERLNPHVKSKTVIFDYFPYENELQNFIDTVGLPTFIVDLRVNKDPLVKRYRLKNELGDDAELGEEDLQKIEEIQKKNKDQTTYWEEMAKNNFGVKVYGTNGDLPLESTKKYVNQIFQKRVFVVVDCLDYRIEGQPEYCEKSKEEIRADQRMIFLNLCAAKDITFVDVNYLLEQYYKAEQNNEDIISQYKMRWSKEGVGYPSNYTPQLIIKVVTNYLSNLKNETRDVLLFNYPSSDQKVNKNPTDNNYPRASDELKLIEDSLGPVRFLSVMTQQRVEHVIQDEIWEMEKPEEKPKPKEGEEGEEGEEAPPEDEEEEGKPKFNVFDHVWTKSNGLPKSLPQWYNKTRKTLKKHFCLNQGSEHTFDKLIEYMDLINEENEQNKEEQDIRKVNIFLQLRYDHVEEEDEIDPPEPESEPEDQNKGDEDEEGEQPEGEQKQEGEEGQEQAEGEGAEQQEGGEKEE